jgi:hypothetical protein
MKLGVIVFAVLLAALASVVSLGSTSHCEGDHEAESNTECACVCCCAPTFICLQQVSGPASQRFARAGSTDMLFLGRLLITDIFRPPTSA